MITILENKYITSVGNKYKDTKNIFQLFEHCCQHPFDYEKNVAPGYCLCKFKDENLGRTYDNLEKINLDYISLDVDNFSIDEFEKQFEKYNYFLYTTSSHTPEQPRFRIIIEITFPSSISNIFDEEKNFNRKIYKETIKNAFPFADSHALDITRFSILPLKNNHFYFKKNMGGNKFNLTTYFYEAKLKFKKEQILDLKNKNMFDDIFNKEKEDVSKNKNVKRYLDTSFNKLHGNVDSNNLLYLAILICLKANDEKTLEDVITKARLERWTTKEIERKIRDAKKFIIENN